MKRLDLDALIRRARAAFNAMPPEDQAAHREAQREGWVRGEMVFGGHGRGITEAYMPTPGDPDTDCAKKLKAAEDLAERYRHALAQILRYSNCQTAGRYAAAALFIADRAKGGT